MTAATLAWACVMIKKGMDLPHPSAVPAGPENYLNKVFAEIKRGVNWQVPECGCNNCVRFTDSRGVLVWTVESSVVYLYRALTMFWEKGLPRPV